MGTGALFTSSKSYFNYPCAHRQYLHDGNCKLIHGYSRSFHFVFEAIELDKCGFVVDYGDLHALKDHLDHMFDHTLLLNRDDPFWDTFVDLTKQGVCELRTMPYGIGMEGTAQYLCEWAETYVRTYTKGRAWVVSVESRENDKNASKYDNPNRGFKGWL